MDNWCFVSIKRLVTVAQVVKVNPATANVLRILLLNCSIEKLIYCFQSALNDYLRYCRTNKNHKNIMIKCLFYFQNGVSDSVEELY